MSAGTLTPAGLILHQDVSTYEWVAGQEWYPVTTLDAANNGYYLMFFVDEEDAASIRASSRS